jgi:alanine racemase
MTGDSHAHALQAQKPGRPTSHSWAEIDLAAVRHNTRALRRLLGNQSFIWAVVKADAYGHGAVPVARAALEGGASGLAVACLAEAAELREAGIAEPVLHLAAGDPETADRIVGLELVQTICGEAMARALSRSAQDLGTSASAHLKIDTGMGRLGVHPGEAVSLARTIDSLPGVELTGVFSHLATAEADDPSYALTQCDRFHSALRGIASAGIGTGIRHLANSTATLRFSDMRFDGVRAGLLIYGIRPDAPDLEPLDMRPALTWTTRVAFLHELPSGSPVSYGCTYVTSRDSLVGVLPIGYADGYPRAASNRARVLVRGHLCPVIGVVCMDHMMIDATDAAGAEVGDEAILLGRQGKAGITANQLAEWAGTVVHEVPTVIGRRVQRVHFDQGRPVDPGIGLGE